LEISVNVIKKTSLDKNSSFCLYAMYLFIGFLMWGSDNICIKEKKKFGGKNLAYGLCGVGLGDLLVGFMQKMKMVGKSVKWSKIGFYFA